MLKIQGYFLQLLLKIQGYFLQLRSKYFTLTLSPIKHLLSTNLYLNQVAKFTLLSFLVFMSIMMMTLYQEKARPHYVASILMPERVEKPHLRMSLLQHPLYVHREHCK